MSETTPRPCGPVCRYCDGSGWVYIPVTMGGTTSVARVACNCVAGMRASGFDALRDGITPTENN